MALRQTAGVRGATGAASSALAAALSRPTWTNRSARHWSAVTVVDGWGEAPPHDGRGCMWEALGGGSDRQTPASRSRRAASNSPARSAAARAASVSGGRVARVRGAGWWSRKEGRASNPKPGQRVVRCALCPGQRVGPKQPPRAPKRRGDVREGPRGRSHERRPAVGVGRHASKKGAPLTLPRNAVFRKQALHCRRSRARPSGGARCWDRVCALAPSGAPSRDSESPPRARRALDFVRPQRRHSEALSSGRAGAVAPATAAQARSGHHLGRNVRNYVCETKVEQAGRLSNGRRQGNRTAVPRAQLSHRPGGRPTGRHPPARARRLAALAGRGVGGPGIHAPCRGGRRGREPGRALAWGRKGRGGGGGTPRVTHGADRR